MGYRDPLYVVKEILTNALDTYALGVVLFEVLCGRLCTSDNNNNKPLIALVRKFYEENNLEEIIYDSIKDEMNPSSLKAFATIAYQCLKEELNQRPLMHDVVRNLESALTYQEYNSGNQNVAGTVGYCDPVYIETRFPSKESDVYSFGVVLFEVLCGRLCISKGHRSLTILAEWCYEQNNLNPIIYGNIKHEISPSSLRVFTTIAYRCLRRERRERPLMKEIVEALETALEYQIPPLPRTLTNSSSSNEYHRPLKPLHWEKTHALVGSLWDVSHNEGIQSRAPEIDISELESLFCKHKYRAHPGYEQHEPENTRLVHPERASDCEIVLHKIKLPVSDLMGAILQLDSHAVTVDQVYNLIEICPTNEEMEMLKSYTGDKEKLGQCEQANNLRDTLNTIKEAIKEIKESTKLVKIMQIILVIGNKLNAGTTKESYTGFKLQSLEKLGDTCATDVNITLLHFLCKVVAEQTPELLDFYEDLIHLQDAYWVHIRSLYEDKSAMIEGFKKVQQECDASANDDGVSNPFRKALRRFLDSTGTELPRLTSFFDEVDLYAESLVVYFGEDPSHCSWKQVISSLGHFIEMFKKAHNQNKRWRDAKKNKSHETVKKSQVHITSMKIKPT
ncbi:hypothetical protein L1887_27609 [Cichorium endivia]|nr:hypothetical protein L1887_27609 [Cichorium endivia]